jgi:hypothetical protein
MAKRAGSPPASTIDIYRLPASTLLTTKEVAGIIRKSVHTLEHWRLHKPDHPLKWKRVERTPLYTAGFVRAYLEMCAAD